MKCVFVNFCDIGEDIIAMHPTYNILSNNCHYFVGRLITRICAGELAHIRRRTLLFEIMAANPLTQVLGSVITMLLT